MKNVVVVLSAETAKCSGLVSADAFELDFRRRWHFKLHLRHYDMTFAGQAAEDSAAGNGVRSNCLLLALFRWFVASICGRAMNLEEMVDSFQCRFVVHVASRYVRERFNP